MGGAPFAEAGHHRHELLTFGAERIRDGGRDGAGDFALYDAISFELTELICEDLLRNAAEALAEFGIAKGTEGEEPEDLNLPFA